MTLKSFMDLKESLGTASIKGVTLLITLLLVSQLLIITPSYALTSTSITPISLGRHSVPEASGIVASRTYSNIYWMHSDWRGTPDDYAVYAVDDEGRTVKKFTVTGASHDNWEDIAIDENRNVWICDIGDNSQQRANYALYKIPEPNPYGSKTTVSVSATYRFALPDGSRDMDSCFVWQGTPYVIHKGTGARMYKIPSLDTSRTVTAQLVATFSKDSYIGGADISQDGRRLVFLSDTNDNQWVIERSASSTNVKDFFTSPTHEWELSFYNGAGGGIAFVNAKYDFVVSSETGGFWMVTQDMYDPSGPEPGDGGGTLSVTTTPVSGEVFVDSVSWGTAPVNKSVSTGAHTVSFGAVSGYTAPADITVSVAVGDDVSVTGTYTEIPPPSTNGTLSVTTTPVDGEVFVNGTSWGEAPVSKSVTAGGYVVSFGSVSGYTTPADIAVSVAAGQNISVTGTYTLINSTLPINGTLTVTTTPVKGEVFVDGSSWGIAPVSKSIAAGLHSVSFGSIPNYTEPDNIPVSVNAGNSTVVTGTYGLIIPPSNNPTYTLSFQGYDFNNKGEVSVLVNNQIIATLPTSYAPQNKLVYVDFSLDITNYMVNGANTLTFQQNLYSGGVRNVVISNSTAVIYSNSTYYSMRAGGSRPSVTYWFTTTSSAPPPINGTLSVTTTPVSGEVFVDGTSWGVAPVSKSVAAGSYMVLFGSVAGYTTPSSVTVSVTAGLTTPVEGTYIPVTLLNGTLSVTTTPVNGEVFVDSTSWGEAPVSKSIEAGSHTVSFGAVSGYTAPSSVAVSVTAGATTSVTGTYISFPSGNSTGPYTLSFQGYDFNNKGEVSVLVNNQIIATLPTSYAPQNKLVYVDFSLNITSYVVNGSNTVTIRQNLYSSGVRNVVITSATSTIYSNSTFYDIWVGGSRPSVTYWFTTTITTPPPPINGTLSVTTTPVSGEVFVDGTSWGVAPVSKSIEAGSHTVSFGAVSGYTSPADVTVSVTEGLTTSVTGTYTEISQQPSPALHVSGSKIVDQDGVEVKLVGFNYGQFPDAYWLSPRNYTQEAINIKNDGFNAVRLVLQWGALETSPSASAFTYNEANFTDFLKMVNSLTDRGIYVIIKLHMDGEPRYQYSNLKGFLGNQYCNEDPDVGNAYESKLGDLFYSQSSASNSTGPFAHFTKMWEKISDATKNNSRVVGYDILNEPWNCEIKTASQAVPIRQGWVIRVGELIADLRSRGDNKIVFYEPAPMWWRYGDAYQGFTFTKQSDNNVVYSWHWYEGTGSAGSKHACAGLTLIERLTDLWGNVNLNVDASCKQEGVWLKQAQDANQDIPFDIGEFGNIYTNSEGDIDQEWIQNSIQLFQNMHVTGYFYWASHTTGTWISDMQASFPWNPTSLTSYAREIPGAPKDSTISPITYDDTSSPVLWKDRDSTAIMAINQQPPLVTQPKTPTATR